MSMRSWLRKLHASRKPRTIRKGSGWRKPFVLERLEERIAPAGQLLYHANDATPVTLTLVGDQLRIVNSSNPPTVLASSPLSAITGGVRIEAGDFNVQLTIDASVPPVPQGIDFGGGGGANTLVGPDGDVTWAVTGPDSGNLGGPASCASAASRRSGAESAPTASA